MPERASATLARSSSSALRQNVAAFGDLLDLAHDEAVDLCAALGELRQIGLEGALEDVAAFGEFLDLGGDEVVDAGAAFGQLGEVVFQAARQHGAAFLEAARLRGRERFDLRDVVVERDREHAAAFDELLDMAGDHAVDGLSCPARRPATATPRPSARRSTWPETMPSTFAISFSSVRPMLRRLSASFSSGRRPAS